MVARPRTDVLLWILSAPLLLSWGLGTCNPVLDLLAVPASVLLAVPALVGWPGLLIVIGIAALGERTRGLDRLLGAVGALSLLASGVAASRPLPWVIVACALLAHRTPREPLARRPARALPWLGVVAWALAGRCLPWGPGLVPEPILAVLGQAIELSPARFPELVPLGIAVAVALALARRAPVDRRGALVGGSLALLAVATFGSRSAWLSAAVIGAVVGGWPVRLQREPVRVVVPILGLCLLCSIRLGAMERWNCEAAGLDPTTVWWSVEPDMESLAVLPGNLPWLVVMSGDGEEVIRYGSNGRVSEAVSLTPPGGQLLSTGHPGIFARVVQDGSEALAQWWDPVRMEPSAQVRLPDCRFVAARLLLDGDAVVISCRGGAVRQVHPTGAVTDRDVTGRGVLAQGEHVALRSGPLSRVLAGDGRGAWLGPWTAGLGEGPQNLFVARGPAGQIEIRGAGPAIPGRDEASDARDRALLRRVLDRARVGVWPGAVGYSGWQASVYVTSPVGGRVHLVDPVVTWHQASALVGAPPRQVVVDVTSGTLYGVNRCGLFEVRIKSTFPWRSTGDEDDKPTETPAEEPAP
jgi:hypothetical protein